MSVGPIATVSDDTGPELWMEKLEACRRQDNSLQDISFETISGTGPNGAIMHYRVTEETDARLEDGHLLVLDSGGQYLDGTTDITRTIAIGEYNAKNPVVLPIKDDMRYRSWSTTKSPQSNAVVIYMMDVSGSMTQMHKDIAKRFFILLYLFLKKNYKKIEVVFIRHHTSAKEVDEEEFFYSRETGGTIVSSALKLTLDTIKARYPVEEWNLYGAQASDGDNWNDDSPGCAALLEKELLPRMQHFSYVEVMPRSHQALWEHYQNVQERRGDVFSMAQIDDPGDIYPVFRRLFKKRMEVA